MRYAKTAYLILHSEKRSAMDIISRDDAYRKGQTKFYTGKPCKRGHFAARYVSTGSCASCTNWKALPGGSNANVGMPPSGYNFPREVPVTPELMSYVHARVLRLIPALAAEYLRLAATREPVVGEEPQHVTVALLAAHDAERASHIAALVKAGWTLDGIEMACRHV